MNVVFFCGSGSEQSKRRKRNALDELNIFYIFCVDSLPVI